MTYVKRLANRIEKKRQIRSRRMLGVRLCLDQEDNIYRTDESNVLCELSSSGSQ